MYFFVCAMAVCYDCGWKVVSGTRCLLSMDPNSTYIYPLIGLASVLCVHDYIDVHDIRYVVFSRPCSFLEVGCLIAALDVDV